MRNMDEEFIQSVPLRDLLPMTMMMGLRYEVQQQGNYTIVLLETTFNGKHFIGVAKRNPHDKPNEKSGFRIAAVRALRAYRRTCREAKSA